MTISQLHQALTFLFKNKENALIKGAPGIGKTDCIKQVANELGMDLIISHPVVSDPTDYKGLPFADTNNKEAHFLPFGELNQLINADKPTLYFLDDIGQASESVQKSCMCILLERRINGFKISDYVTCAAATNRREDKAGVQGILEPVKSRFATIIELEADADDWIVWAINNNMPTSLVSFIRFRPEQITAFKATRDMVNTPCPRTIAAVGRIQNAGVPDDIRFDLFKGAVGEAFAVEYNAFLRIWMSLPSVDNIILNPAKVDIPKDPATLYALSGALAEAINDVNSDAIMTYVERMPPEFGTVVVKDAITRWDGLSRTKAFINWSIKNNAILN
jgi:hypothetical protein